MKITYNGKTIETKHIMEVSEEERIQLQKECYAKPPFSEVQAQMKKIAADGVRCNKINQYYFKELMAKVQSSEARWSLEDVLNSRELLGIFKSKVLSNPSFYPPDNPMIINIETALRLGGKAYAQFPTQFPMKTAKEIILKYNINNNYYDFSCGWGVRLIAALRKNINYYGTDPNYLLVDKLNELTTDWKNTIKNNSLVDIRAQGSEVFIPEWKNKIGLAFSSPPYFNLEDYKIGNQSYKKETTYDEWITNYIYTTIQNIYEYLIPKGILAININHINNYPIVVDIKNTIESNKFKLIGTELLQQRNRTKRNGDENDNSELIYIYQKEE